MPTFFFPDNTVLINFTLIGRHDLLEWFVRRSGQWTLSVSRECHRSARQPGLSGLADWGLVFHEPLVPSPTELVNARVIAEQMRKPGDFKPSQHMGEAETIAIVVNRGLAAVFLTDDHDAARRASAEPLISVASTTKILAFAEAKGRLEHTVARRYLADLLNAGRVLGNPPVVADYDGYVASLRSASSDPTPR